MADVNITGRAEDENFSPIQNNDCKVILNGEEVQVISFKIEARAGRGEVTAQFILGTPKTDLTEVTDG